MKERFGTAEPSPLALISAGTASTFMWESFQVQFGLPTTISSALVSYSQWGVVGGGGKNSLGAAIQTLQVGLHRPPVLPEQLLTELIILHIHKLKK